MFFVLLCMTVSMTFSPAVIEARYVHGLRLTEDQSMDSGELSPHYNAGNYRQKLLASELLAMLEERDQQQTWTPDAEGPMEKRAPWAPSEIRVDEFMQKLLRSRGNKHSKRVARRGRATVEMRRPEDELLVKMEEADRKLSTLNDLIGALEYSRLVQAKSGHQQLPSTLAVAIDEVPSEISREDDGRIISEDDEDDIIMLLSPKDNNNNNNNIIISNNNEEENQQTAELLRRPSGSFQMMTSSQRLLPVRRRRDNHPVYFGMGQNAAGSALSTFARLQAENEKRIEKNPDGSSYGSSSPVGFIGK